MLRILLPARLNSELWDVGLVETGVSAGEGRACDGRIWICPWVGPLWVRRAHVQPLEGSLMAPALW